VVGAASSIEKTVRGFSAPLRQRLADLGSELAFVAGIALLSS
jgi:hypothetical protein